MKNLLNISKLLLLGCIFLITSCNEDFLDLKPLDQISDKDVWQDPSLAELFVNNIYYDFENMRVRERYSNLVDEVMVWSYYDCDFNKCLITQDRIPNWSGQQTWNGLYQSVRKCNIYLKNVDQIQFDDNLNSYYTF